MRWRRRASGLDVDREAYLGSETATALGLYARQFVWAKMGERKRTVRERAGC